MKNKTNPSVTTFSILPRRSLVWLAAGAFSSPPTRAEALDGPPVPASGLSAPAWSTSVAAAQPVMARADAEWRHFKARFLTSDGRVTDSGNGNISHSEGQGLVLLLAVHFNEQATFARALRWTRSALARPEDHLLAWCHRPDQPARPGDRNNATDGDLLVAWALAAAADQWGDATYRGLATAMARDILGKMVVATDDRPMLLPGCEGFLLSDSIVVNPSYYIYPAFLALQRLLPSRQWLALEEGGLRMARMLRFGRWGLVPDWVSIPRGMGMVGIAPDRPARFSYDAVRVPLYLAWGGYGREPMVSAAAQFWHDPSLLRMPAWADLRTNDTSPYAADAGIAAVAQLSAMAAQPSYMPLQVGQPVLSSTYYAAALRLMSVMALGSLPRRSPTRPTMVMAR